MEPNVMEKLKKSLPVSYTMIVYYENGHISVTEGDYDRKKLLKGKSMHDASRIRHRVSTSTIESNGDTILNKRTSNWGGNHPKTVTVNKDQEVILPQGDGMSDEDVTDSCL